MTPHELRKLHESIPVPPELEERVQKALRPKRRPIRFVARTMTACAACAALFALSVNLSPAWAASLYEVPLLGDVAQFFTFRESHEVDEAKDIQVRVPAIRGTGESQLDKEINQRIADKIDQLEEEATRMAEEYLTAYNATKQPGDPDFWKMKVEIDYEIHYTTPEVVSFVLNSTITGANAYTQQYFYNIDLKTGEDLTLEGLLGPDYIDLCNQAVKEGMAKKMAEDPDAMYYSRDDEDDFNDDFAFQTIEPDQSFYLNEQGQVVIVFPKYAIAPGYMGIQEFVVSGVRTA